MLRRLFWVKNPDSGMDTRFNLETLEQITLVFKHVFKLFVNAEYTYKVQKHSTCMGELPYVDLSYSIPLNQVDE